MSSTIQIQSPFFYFIVFALLAALAGWWLYFSKKEKDKSQNKIRFWLFGLRFLTILISLILLLDIFFKKTINETVDPLIVIAIDNSESMLRVKDSSIFTKKINEGLNALKSDLGEKFQTKTIFFGSETSGEEKNPDFKEKETDFENALNYIDNHYSNTNIGAVIFISDGIFNKGVNPVNLVSSAKFPVYTIATGDTKEEKDIWIQKINHNEITYNGNSFPVEVIVNAKKLAGKEAIIKLKNNGKELAAEKIKIQSDNFSVTKIFTLQATSNGIVRYDVEVQSLVGEKNISNNSRSFITEIIDNKEKILLVFNSPHPDVVSISEIINTHPGYSLECLPANDFKGNVIPYSLVIFHGYSSQNNSKFNALLNECKSNHIPYWMVNPVSTDNIPGVKINVNVNVNRSNDAEALVDKNFELFKVSDNLKNLIEQCPAVKTYFGNYTVMNGSNALINQRIGSVETQNPVLIFSEFNDTKCAAFAGDGLWKWKMRDYLEHKNFNLFDELVSKTVQYLSSKMDKSFFRIACKRLFNENEEIEIDAEVYNKSYEAITLPEVLLTLTNHEGKNFNYTFSKRDKTYSLNVGNLLPGDYKFKSSVTIQNETLTKEGSFSVKEIDAEKINTVANHNLLSQMSNRSGGKMFYPDEIKKLSEEILKNDNVKPITYSQKITSPLIDEKWLLLIILVLISSEWFLRKRFFVI